MLKEQYSGRYPSHFQVNPIVKAYIISESFLWSAWNFVAPIFALFVIANIQDATVQTAAIAFSIHQVSRVIFELMSGKYLSRSSNQMKLLATILGTLSLSVAYVGLAFSMTEIMLYIFYAMAGFGLGVATPAKNALFSMHLDKNKEATEWGMADAACFICNALASIVGGFVAFQYGFTNLLLVACFVNLVSIVPYLLYLHKTPAK